MQYNWAKQVSHVSKTVDFLYRCKSIAELMEGITKNINYLIINLATKKIRPLETVPNDLKH